MSTGNYSFFWRTENRDMSRSQGRDLIVRLPVDLTWEQALEAAYAAGMGKGSNRSGCYEIQGPRGIWSSTSSGRITARTVRFQTWAEWEAELEGA